ncbi:MAG: hypothetical protein H7202_01960 [Pedobacter sp.]|nr:hypothetical protein [Pedobacter sp.]
MNNSDWLDIDVLEDYLDGKLDAKTMHSVERLSLEDPFVAEALAGLILSPKRVQSLSLLQKQLQDRIAQKPVAQKRWQITSQRLSIAAAAAVLFVTVSLLFWMRESSNRKQIASSTSKKVEVALAPVKVAETQTPSPSLMSVQKGDNGMRSIHKKETSTEFKSEKVALNEVVITGAGTTSREMDRVLVRTTPVGGWNKFEDYVLNNNKLLTDKRITGRYVTISFDLDKDGSPIHIKVIRRHETVPIQTDAEEMEAIRLVKDGPKWTLPENSGSSPNAAFVNIKF